MKKVLLIAFMVLFFLINNGTVVAADEQQIEEEIIYNILVDRYNNGDSGLDTEVNIHDSASYHGGDLQGIILKLDALQEIGVTTLSLSPIMANATHGYHGNWIEDFYFVEDQFGTMEDLNRLVNEAHDRDMKIVLELVTNYVASSHPFVDDPGKTDWFIESKFTEPEWMSNVATLNLENPEVEAYLIDVADFWMKETDVDGFKLHAVDQAPIRFIKEFTKHIKGENPDFYLLGDILITDENSEELVNQTGLDAVENQILYEAMADVFAKPDQPVEEVYETWKNNKNQHGLLYMDDFYSKRFTQKFSENGRNSLTAWTLALTYMYLTPGTPTLLQGSELPMYGGDAEESQRLVPFNSGEAELKEFHNRISSLRSQFPVLQHGDFEHVGSDGAMSVFKRTLDNETMFIAINNGSESGYIDVSGIDSGMQLKGYLGDNLARQNENGDYRIGLARESTEVYSILPDKGINWVYIGFVGSVLLLFIVGVSYLSIKGNKKDK